MIPSSHVIFDVIINKVIFIKTFSKYYSILIHTGRKRKGRAFECSKKEIGKSVSFNGANERKGNYYNLMKGFIFFFTFQKIQIQELEQEKQEDLKTLNQIKAEMLIEQQQSNYIHCYTLGFI